MIACKDDGVKKRVVWMNRGNKKYLIFIFISAVLIFFTLQKQREKYSVVLNEVCSKNIEQGEYIELLNTSRHAISLEGFFFNR